MPLSEIKRVIPEEIYTRYTKIAIYRDPFEVAISCYWYRQLSDKGVSFEDFLLGNPNVLTQNLRIAPLQGPISIDHPLRYHQIEEDLTALGMGEILSLYQSIRAKGNYRPKSGQTKEEVYMNSPAATQFVQKLCREEIDYFNYSTP